MSGRIRYRQSGVFIHCEEPSFEEFYRVLLPLLKAYGITTEFPADKPSTETYISGIKFDVWIGESPHAIHYGRTQESFYSNAFDDKLLEASALANLETGKKLSFKIISGNTVPVQYHSSGFSLTIEIAGEKEQVEAMRNDVEPLLARHRFDSVELEMKPLDEESQESVNTSKPEPDAGENYSDRQPESPPAASPKILPADYQTKTVVPEQPTRKQGLQSFNGRGSAVDWYSGLHSVLFASAIRRLSS